jgi:hypothetical protein
VFWHDLGGREWLLLGIPFLFVRPFLDAQRLVAEGEDINDLLKSWSDDDEDSPPAPKVTKRKKMVSPPSPTPLGRKTKKLKPNQELYSDGKVDTRYRLISSLDPAPGQINLDYDRPTSPFKDTDIDQQLSVPQIRSKATTSGSLLSDCHSWNDFRK